MKSNFFQISLIFALLSVSLAEIYRDTYADPEYPGQCVVRGLVLSPGDRIRDPERCAKITCYKDSQVTIVTCGAFIAPPGCTMGEPVDEFAMYPQCCKRRVICSNGSVFNT